MTDQNSDASGRDDSDLRDDVPTPSHSGAAGGTLARDIASHDEEKLAEGGDPEPTRVTKDDKVQPQTNSRADHEGAQES